MDYTGEIVCLVTALCWTLSSLSFASAGRRVGSLSVNLIRLVLAGVFFTIYGAVVRGQPLPLDAPASTWFWLSLSGFIGFFFGDLCLFRALVTLGPRLTTLLMSLAPPIAAGIEMLILEEHLTLTNWLGMLITLLGVSWVVIERRTDANGKALHTSLKGVLLGAGAAAGQAVGAVMAKIGMGPENYDPFAATQIRVFPGVLGFVVLLYFLRWYPRVWDTLRTPRAVGLIATGAFLGPFLGVALFLLALQHILAGVAQTIVSIIPVLILPFVIVLYKEKVSWRAALGAVVAVGGVALLFWKETPPV